MIRFFKKNDDLIVTSLEGLTEQSFTEYLWRSFCYLNYVNFLFNLWGIHVNFKA